MKRIALCLLVLSMLLGLCACSKDKEGFNAQKKKKEYPSELTKMVEVRRTDVEEVEGEYILDGRVRCPRFEDYMQEAVDYAEKAKTVDEFESLFYKKLAQLIGEDAETERLDIVINLSMIDYSKTEWSEEELHHLLQQEAFKQSLENFCMGYMEEVAPSWSEEDESYEE